MCMTGGGVWLRDVTDCWMSWAEEKAGTGESFFLSIQLLLNAIVLYGLRD